MPLDFTDTLRQWRHYLHAHPELSRQEAGTAAYVCAELEKLGVAYTSGVGGHGVVATIARGSSNRSVGLRADMDALPIIEATGKSYASTNPGVMHACGHDGHTASLLGAAQLLVEDGGWAGTVQLVFQPAEEGYAGAEAMVRDGLFTRFPMERMFGYHNWPGLETGTVMLHDGPLMAAAAHLTITIHGKAGHAAMPHQAVDPVQGAAQMITALNTIVARNTDPLQAAVVSICTMQAGIAQNQIPDSAVLGGTFRALTPAMMAFIEDRIHQVVAGVAAALGLTAEVAVGSRLAPTINNSAEAALGAKVAAGMGLTVRRDMLPTMGAEDFGRFLAEVPGSYAWIGNGDSAGLHHPAFDYNDEILPIAAHYLASVAKAALI